MPLILSASLRTCEDAAASSLEPCDASPLQENDAASSRSPGDASPSPIGPECAWCRSLLDATRSHQRFCSQRCRQAAWRIRRQSSLDVAADAPKRMAYADPPYPGFAKRLYAKESSYAGEVDHAKLIASLLDRFDGWALSTGAYALRELLPLCPPAARVCAWVKPIGASPLTRGVHNCWEPLIVVPGRERRPGKRDFLIAQPARRGGKLPGRKPLAFCAWLFSLLGMQPGDTFDDLFPGSGIVGRAWAELSCTAAGDASSSAAGNVAGGS